MKKLKVGSWSMLEHHVGGRLFMQDEPDESIAGESCFHRSLAEASPKIDHRGGILIVGDDYR